MASGLRQRGFSQLGSHSRIALWETTIHSVGANSCMLLYVHELKILAHVIADDSGASFDVQLYGSITMQQDTAECTTIHHVTQRSVMSRAATVAGLLYQTRQRDVKQAAAIGRHVDDDRFSTTLTCDVTS
jgi:hypothetical protein